jgi:hypothetical protein
MSFAEIPITPNGGKGSHNEPLGRNQKKTRNKPRFEMTEEDASDYRSQPSRRSSRSISSAKTATSATQTLASNRTYLSALKVKSEDLPPPTLANVPMPVRKRILRYRRFTSSISALFEDEQVVCGAVSCFGLLQSTRNQHMLRAHNKRYPGPDWTLPIAFMCTIFLVVASYFFFPPGEGVPEESNNNGNGENGYYRGYYDGDGYDYYYYQLVPESPGAIVRSILVTCFLFFLAIYSPVRRSKVRQRILLERLRNDRKYFPNESQMARGHWVEDTRQAACAHTLCGCYPVDPPYTLEDGDEDEMLNDDLCQRSLRAAHACCFEKTCRPFGWMQLFGCCAVAQEAREMKHLLPTWQQHIDYITHQPFTDYSDGREETTLSKLSIWLGATFFCTLVVIVEILLIDTESGFTLEHAMALMATFGESFLLLTIVHCVYRKSYLSLDGITKFFSAGFLLGVPTAYVMEVAMSYLFYLIANSTLGLLHLLSLEDASDFLTDQIFVFKFIEQLLNAFIVAATIEEFCKYYFFRMIDHPDLLFMNTANEGYYLTEEEEADSDGQQLGGGGEGGGGLGVRTGNYPTIPNGQEISDSLIVTMATGGIKTYRQMASSIAIAMLSVAVGLACAENILYVFFRSEDMDAKGDHNQFITLGIRSLFPVHPLCAAMQSVAVIKKFVEYHPKFSSQGANFSSVGVGTVVMPAIIVHGSFDAILMIVSLYAERPNDGSINVERLSHVAWIGAFFTMVLGMIWYIIQSRHQKKRLRILEEKLVLSYYRQHEERQQRQHLETGTRTGTYESPIIRPSLFDHHTSSSAMPHGPGGMLMTCPSDEAFV